MTDDITVTTQTGPYAIIPVWILGVGLTGSELATYVSLRSFADRGGEAHPRVRTIAARAGVSQSSAERAIRRMRDLGILHTVQLHRPDGSISGCSYTLIDVRPVSNMSDFLTGGTRTADGGGTRTGDGGVPAQLKEQEQTNELTKEQKAPPPLRGGPPAPQAARAARGSRLPENFQPTPAMIEWARNEAPAATPRDHEQFVDYWRSKSGRDATKTDWVATWRRWMRTESDKRQPATSTTNQRVAAGLALAARFEALEIGS